MQKNNYRKNMMSSYRNNDEVCSSVSTPKIRLFITIYPSDLKMIVAFLPNQLVGK